MPLPDWYVKDIQELLAKVRANLASLESGQFRIGELRPGELPKDTTDQAIETDRRTIAAYEWILARHENGEPI